MTDSFTWDVIRTSFVTWSRAQASPREDTTRYAPVWSDSCVSVVARKLAVLAWHLLTKGEPYRYASPTATEKKLADLRRSQHVLHPRHLGNRGSHWGHNTRVRKSLATVLATESLPAPTPATAAETRVFAPLGTTTLLEHIGREQRVATPHRKRTRSHAARARSIPTKKPRTRVRKRWHHHRYGFPIAVQTSRAVQGRWTKIGTDILATVVSEVGLNRLCIC